MTVRCGHARFVYLSWEAPTRRGFIRVWPFSFICIGFTVWGRWYVGWPRLSGPYRWMKGVAYRLPTCTVCHTTIFGGYEQVAGHAQHSTIRTFRQCPR